MQILKNKSKISAITFVLVLTFSAILVALPTVVAHDPAWTIPTWTYIEAYPDPIGVGQSIFLVFWRDFLPKTAEGMYGDRWDFTIEVTKPDNTKQTLGPYTCDPVGGAYAIYVPDQVGTYSFVCYFPGHTYGTSGIANPQRDTPYGSQWFDDVMIPSESLPATVVVQQDPLEQWPEADLPTDYWTRPVDASLREWSRIAGNWLNDGRDNLDTTAPKTSHIVWTKEQDFGGLTGGQDYGTIGYYEGSSYERKWAPKAIIQGRLYYRMARSDRAQALGTMCVDLRTGEELLFMNRTSITQGVIYDYESPNQHGTIPYLLVSGTTTDIFDPTQSSRSYEFYDPFTGEWLWTITDRPSGISAVGTNGEPLIYIIDFRDNWMALWNATAPEALLGGTSGTGQWQWRPVGKTVNGTAGAYEFIDAIEWNVSIPEGVAGSTSFMKVLSDRIIFGDDFQRFGGRAYTGEVTISALSIAPGHEGELIFSKQLTTPPIGPSSNMTLQFEGDKVDEENGVFVVRVKESMQWYGFDIDTGDMLWGPTERQEDFMMYDRSSTIYDGMLLHDGYSGVYAYDITNGDFLWLFRTNKCEFDGPYEYYPPSTIVPADGKLYITTGEHSHTQPLYRGWSMYCVDANTGQGIWNITGVWNSPVIADGYLVSMNGMDNRIYCFGKGQTATTVEAPLTAVPLGSSVIIQGTVTDQSPGAKDTPAIADTDMTAWMEYLYKQHAMPMVTGVPVTLDAIDSNGNFVHIATVTSDMSGLYSYMWAPEQEGKYTIIATFEGSDSYFSSYAETAVGVDPAPSPYEPIEPEEPSEAPFITTEQLIIAVVIVAIVIAAVSFYVLRRRRKIK